MSLYIIATPIGNLEDITLRALRILKEVDLVLCEDTRETRKLLNHYDIKTMTQSYHAQSKLSKIDSIIAMLADGRNIALVSDAGTPAISDPGSLLVKKVREELPDVEILSVPGPSALTSAFSTSGITGGEFVFLGFLPHKKGRETLFKEIANSPVGGERPYIFYESPHRLIKTLESLVTFAPERRVQVAKEITKVFEQYIDGTPAEVLRYFTLNQDKVRGEFVVIVYSK